ncbi:hypothetical protein HPULCUR_006053 [Helicostylum pulchrum]|uniref:Uncharacterized protein n=1 Tax=Helicostylum pulchrum TaxID=562976 RepID=A0ABP9Y2S8_9FUNG
MTQPRRPERLISPITIAASSGARSDLHTDMNIRYPPRIPRLVRRPAPTAITTTELDHRPSSISSAISITREYARRTEPAHDLHCAFDEKAVDLSAIREVQIEETANNRNYVPLHFEILQEDGGRYSTAYRIENVLRNDGTVYCSQRYGTVNILLKFEGCTSCSVSHIIIKSPQYGYTAPCKEGMIFASHKPIDIESTRGFDLFTQENYERYTEMNREQLDDSDPAAWFNASMYSQSVIDMKEKSCKYILIKLLGNDTSNLDLQYIGLIGYTGSRCFAKGNLC